MDSPCPGNISSSLRILQITQHLPISCISFIQEKLQRWWWKFRAQLSHTLCPRSTDSGECKRVTTHFLYEHNDSPKPGLLRGEFCFWGGKLLIFRGKIPRKNSRIERGMPAPLACKGKGSSSAAPSWNPELEPRCLAVLVNPQQGSHTALQGAALVPFPLLVQTFQAWHNPDMEQGVSWGLKKRLL